MKRFGFPAILSAVYVTALVLIFSSNYSKENSFLYPADSNAQVEKATIIPNQIRATSDQKPTAPVTLSTTSEEEVVDSVPPSEPESDHHSPESSEVK